MFSCLQPTLCKIMGPYSTAIYTNLAAISGVGSTTALVGTGSDDTVWKNRELAITKYDPTDPDNCYTSWTAGMIYPKGATLCDGIIYQCEDPATCGVYVPGATGSEIAWSELNGATVPASQTKTYDYYARDRTYGYGDFAISRQDQQTYKCTNDTSGACQNNPPAGSQYWTPLVVKALNPSDMPTVYGGWIAAYRYQAGYLVGISTADTVYECTTETFCQYHPTEDAKGAFGWTATFYRIPDDANSNTPPTIYYDASSPHQWLDDDVALYNGQYYRCNSAVSCRCDDDITTCAAAWSAITISNGVAANTMQEYATICQVREQGKLYDLGAVVCTAKENANAWDNVYQCTNTRGCELTPGVNQEWEITRRRGTITESVTVVAAFDFEWDVPYAQGDYVVYMDQLYECTSNRGLCVFFPPDITDWASIANDGFALDDKYDFQAFGASQPYTLVTDKAYGDLTEVTIDRSEVIKVDYFASLTFIDDYAGYHWFVADEEACVMSQTVKCVAEDLCNFTPPYAVNNTDGSAWEPTGYLCEYNTTYPEAVFCDFMIDDDPSSLPAMLPGDIVCDDSKLPEITWYTCREAGAGGYNCTQFSPITHADTDEIASAWYVNTTVEDLQLFVPNDMWYASEADLTLDCYDWKDATDKYSDFPYVFQLADIACDLGMVFECIDSSLCQTTRPSEDQAGAVWFSLPYKEDVQQPAFVPQMDCSEFELLYPYLLEDAVCNEYGDLFKCREPIQCAFSYPSYYDELVWELIDPVYVTYVEAANVTEVNCTTYDAVLNGAKTGNFSLGEVVCDADRAWSCTYVKNCNKFSPQYSYDNELRGWELTALRANVDYTYEDTVFASVALANLTDCVPEGIISSVAPQVSSTAIWTSPASPTGFTVTDGVVCATSEPEQLVVRASLYNVGTFNFEDNDEDYAAVYEDALDAYYSTLYTAAGVNEANLKADE